MDEALTFADVAAWEAWLTDHHASSDGVWLRVRKKNADRPAITALEAGDAAMCFGWIDSHRRSLDADFFLQRYSPRRPQGTWSKVNVERAESLIAQGRMRPAGQAQIDAAKSDGRWAGAYEPQRTAETPPDLADALAGDDAARKAFERLGKTDQYLLALPLLKARTPAARAARLAKIVQDLAARYAHTEPL